MTSGGWAGWYGPMVAYFPGRVEHRSINSSSCSVVLRLMRRVTSSRMESNMSRRRPAQGVRGMTWRNMHAVGRLECHDVRPYGAIATMIIRKIRISFTALSAMLAIVSVFACSSEQSVRNVEVTREVTVIQEVPVTVETVKTVEVTREATQVQEIPVTVEVLRTVEVTREPRTVEVTREVPVTRIVAATPVIAADDAATELPTPSPVAVAATPTPTAAPVVPEEVPTPVVNALSSDTRFGNWWMDKEQYGSLEVNFFRIAVLSHESPSDVPGTHLSMRQSRGAFILYRLVSTTCRRDLGVSTVFRRSVQAIPRP